MLPRGAVPSFSSKRKDLQGIRGIAILGVLGFHFYPTLFPNGYLGVDQFFVLSGFLMCMLLTRSQKLPIFFIFTEFYTRRFKRILPLYFLFILLTTCILYTGFPDTAILQNQESAGKALVFMSNRPETVEENYFKKLSIAIDLFTHTWSLSVEIQFYFIVPFIFLIGHQFKGATKYGFYSVIGVISFIYFAISPELVAFNSVFARIWQFLIGMLAYFGSKWRCVPFERKLKNLEDDDLKSKLMEENKEETEPDSTEKTINLICKFIILTSLVTVLVIPCSIDPMYARPFSTIFTGVLMMFTVEDIFLNSNALVYLGNISYALYLIHWPMFAYIKLVIGNNSFVLGETLLAAIVFAAVVHEFFERWYLKQSNLVVSVLVCVLFISSVFLINKDTIGDKMIEKKVLKPVDSPWNRTYPRLDAVTEDMSFDDAERMNAYWNRHDHMAPELQEPNCVKRSPKHERWCDFKENGTEYHIALFGNSYTMNHHKMFIQECKHRAFNISKDDETSCEPLTAPTNDTTCIAKLQEFVEFIQETNPDYAFIFQRFFAAANPYDTDENDLEHDRTYLEMRSQLRKMLPFIKKKLFIMDSFPRIKADRIQYIAQEMKAGKKTMEEINKSLYNPMGFERGRRRHAELLRKECNSKCELIDYMDAFWNKTMNAFQYFDAKGFSYFTSPLHISAHGIEHVRPIYTKICARL